MPAEHPCAGGLWVTQYTLNEESGELGGHQRSNQWFTLQPPTTPLCYKVLRGNGVRQAHP